MSYMIYVDIGLDIWRAFDDYICMERRFCMIDTIDIRYTLVFRIELALSFIFSNISGDCSDYFLCDRY